MVTITSTSSPTPVAPTTALTSSNTSSPQDNAPLYLTNFSAQTSAALLGLSQPRSLGDLEALFAQISSELGETQTKTEGFSRAAQSSARSTTLLAAARNLLEMLGVALTVEVEAKEIAKQEGIITEKKDELSTLNTQRDGLVSQRDRLQDQLDTKRETRTGIDLEVVGLYIEYYALLTVGAFDAAADVMAQIESKESQSAALLAEIQTLETQVSDLNGQITDLDFQILGVEIDLAVAEAAKKASEDALDAAVNLLALLFITLLPFTLFLALGAKSESAQDSFALRPDNIELDEVLKDAIDRIAGREIDETERNLVKENLLLNLPAGTGNPDAVIDRAVGFAGSVAVLQGALQQVLFGTTASTTDASDVSGRLRFLV